MAKTTSRSPKQAVAASTLRVAVLPVRDNVHFPAIVTTLLVGREISLRALNASTKDEGLVLVLGQREMTVDEPVAADMHRLGTLSEVMQVLPMPDGTARLVLRGLSRCRVQRLNSRSGYFVAECSPLEAIPAQGPSVEALKREAIELFQDVASLGRMVPTEALELLPVIDDAGELADNIVNQLVLKPAVKQQVLEMIAPIERIERVIKLLASERQVLQLQSDLRSKVERELGNSQREYFLREQLRAIQNELSGDTELSPEGQELKVRIEAAKMPDAVRDKASAELRRLDRAASNSPENMVIRTYLEWLCDLPWSITTEDRLDIHEASKILDRDHYGLQRVKDRILDFLAVRQLSQSLRGPILCFAGPPGVGKTSLGRSIAEALGRKFVRLSLGGVRDEAELRGHRRTYIGSMPGRLIHGIHTCGSRNPVFMLDEIDKMGMDMRGDPTSALLEVLDPEQNSGFTDHYVELPFDLSAVMFIMTANVVESIPAPLRDRMEIIHFPSYTEAEKLHIARSYLVPKKSQEHGIRGKQLTIQDDALQTIVRHYTREAGVRSLEREIATVCRKSARRLAEGAVREVTVDADNLSEFLGRSRYRYGQAGAQDEVGTATGLAFTEFGGDTLSIEVNLMPSLAEQPNLMLTGNLGQVMKESAMAAVSYIRAHPDIYGPFRHDVHIHVPEGAIPKDGPSAGVTIATALASAATGRPVRRDLAMTGEITLRGNVLPVGGVREKALAAHRAGIRDMVLPADNMADLDELPVEVRDQMCMHPVRTLAEVFELALRPKTT
ncbi:MAG: endopeptidase La [Chthonomonas sp.]|nr:endopeptidase La [Chthonomonas sp.]